MDKCENFDDAKILTHEPRNRFTICNQKADEQKRTHYARQEAQARAHFARHPELAARVDVEMRVSRDWWKDAALWPDDESTEEHMIYLRQDGYRNADGYLVTGAPVGFEPAYQELVKRPVERDVVGRMRRECDRLALLHGTVKVEPVEVYVSLWTDVLREVLWEDRAAVGEVAA